MMHMMTSPAFIMMLCVTFLVCKSMFTDAAAFRIPNSLNFSLLLAYPLTYFLIPSLEMPWQAGLMAFAIVFIGGYVLFILRVMGGGDVKMLTVVALWIGWGETLLWYVLFVALVGGAITVVLVFLRIWVPFAMMRLGVHHRHIPRVLSNGQPVPYGLAIGAVFLWMLWTNQLPLHV